MFYRLADWPACISTIWPLASVKTITNRPDRPHMIITGNMYLGEGKAILAIIPSSVSNLALSKANVWNANNLSGPAM